MSVCIVNMSPCFWVTGSVSPGHAEVRGVHPAECVQTWLARGVCALMLCILKRVPFMLTFSAAATCTNRIRLVEASQFFKLSYKEDLFCLAVLMRLSCSSPAEGQQPLL